MEKLYIVHWGYATQDDRGNANAFCKIHGIYTTLDGAKIGLRECQENLYIETVHDADGDVSVYGSESEEYFEIDYSEDGISREIYLTITAVEQN